MACSLVRDPGACGLQAGCVFDFDCQVCREPVCQDVTFEEDCGAREGCFWTGIACLEEGQAVECSELSFDACEGTSECTFSQQYGVCHDAGTGLPCSLLAFSECEADGRCEFSNQYAVCFESGEGVPCEHGARTRVRVRMRACASLARSFGVFTCMKRSR